MVTAALDIGGTRIKAGLVENGTLLESREADAEAKGGGVHVLERAAALIGEFSGFSRIGVSTAGYVDFKSGSIVYASENIPGYTHTNVRAFLEERFQVPVTVENDGYAAAAGEAVWGAGRGTDDFLCLTYGTGVGGAVVMGGKLYRGSRFAAGAFGHMTTHEGGRLCTCGRRGCYEQYASAGALVRAAVKTDPGWDSGWSFLASLEDPRAGEVLKEWLHEVLIGIASLIHIFNPPLVILGGGIMSDPRLPAALAARIGEYLMPSHREALLRAARQGNHAGLLGAAWLAERR